MLRPLLALLLLTTAGPALAAAEPEVEQRAPEPEARSSGGEERPFIRRIERIERASRRAPEPRAPEQRASEPVIERPRRSEADGQFVAPEPVAREARPRRERPDRRPTLPAGEADRADSVQNWRWREREAERRRRAVDPVVDVPSPVLGEPVATPRGITPPVMAAPVDQRDRRSGESLRNRIATEGWRREWREDRRFDWRRHRDRHWNRFNLGIYIDPFGRNYRRWNPGWRLPSRHFGRSFWIHDPWYYRLPPAYGPYRWVRYWDDALLVDLRTGRVVDVIHNFFW